MSLSDSSCLLTALGNDVAFDAIFSSALAAYSVPGDVVVALSCSGSSPNVVSACLWARQHELAVVALTGRDGGSIGRLADIHVNVPSASYGMIEDVHLSVGHMIVERLRSLAGLRSRKPRR
jgi:D-sedoheptulose 7-phosphate isomerase